MAAWTKVETQGKYTIWRKRTSKGHIYNVTTTGRVPKTDSGYFNKEALKQLKGLH